MAFYAYADDEMTDVHFDASREIRIQLKRFSQAKQHSKIDDFI